MEQEKSNSKLKAIIIVLALLLVGSLGYLYKITTDNQILEADVKTISTEKESFLSELNALKRSYDAALDEKTVLTEELEAERQKVIDLIRQVEKAQNDTKTLAGLRSKFKGLEDKNKLLLAENERLIFENQQLKIDLDSTKVVLTNEKDYNKVLVGQNEELSSTVKKASKLSILNLNTAAFKVRNSGKEISTDRARRADILKISFTIAENNIAKSGDRQYYVQIIDPNSNVLGAREDVEIEGKVLKYSFISKVNFKNSTVQVVENLPGENFDSGTYFINIYDDTSLVAKSSFSLR
jgi:uncharacterized protein (DUF3084 family)